jgi:DNA (cytosine-5)-methyltransferase 1
MALTHGELFAGISGFGQGFERHGIETKWHVEIDKTAQSVLRRHYPNTLLLDDVRTVSAHNLPHVDVITFGSPCQDLSVAGRRKGLAGERSGLFYEAIRIIGELKPTFAIWENVPGAFSSNNGRDFAYVLSAFLECGARDIAWATLDAQHFGVAQRRRRVFVVADFAGERAGEILFVPESGTGHLETSREARQGTPATVSASAPSSLTAWDTQRARIHDASGTAPSLTASPTGGQRTPTVALAGTLAASGAGTERPAGQGNELDFLIPTSTAHAQTYRIQRSDDYDEDDTASTLAARDYKSATDLVTVFTQNQREEVRDLGGIAGALAADAGAHQQNYVASAGVRRLTPTECERLQGFPDGWTERDHEGGVISDSARYRMLGNAVCANVAEWIGKRIAEAHERAETERAA